MHWLGDFGDEMNPEEFFYFLGLGLLREVTFMTEFTRRVEVARWGEFPPFQSRVNLCKIDT